MPEPASHDTAPRAEPDATTDPFAGDAVAGDDAPTGGIFHARCRELVALKKEQDAIDERLAVIKKRRATLEAYLLDAFAEAGLQSVNIDGRTVYLQRQLWAGAPDKAAAYDALKAAGLDEYATRGFNSQAVSALFREWERNGEPVPVELVGVITTGERFSIRVTK